MLIRLHALTDVFAVPSVEETSVTALLALIKQRLIGKAAHLRDLVPRLKERTSLDANAIGCGSVGQPNIAAFCDNGEAYENVRFLNWEVSKMLRAAFDPTPNDFPLQPVAMVGARHFATRLANGVRIEAPEAHAMVAALYGARDWQALTGPRSFFPVTEPLYVYRKGGESGWANLEPCSGLGFIEDEVEAQYLYQTPATPMSFARVELTARPGLLSAATVLMKNSLRSGCYDYAIELGGRTFGALDSLYRKDCYEPLAPGKPTHARYIRLLAAMWLAYELSGDRTQAADVRQRLSFRGCYFCDEVKNLVGALPEGAYKAVLAALAESAGNASLIDRIGTSKEPV